MSEERYIQIPMQAWLPEQRAKYQPASVTNRAKRLEALDRFKQVPLAQKIITYTESLLKEKGGSYYLECEDDYTLIDYKTVTMMKGALFGMITELKADAQSSPVKEQVLYEVGVRS